MQINNTEILLYGGFSEGTPSKAVHIYRNENSKEEGEFTGNSSLEHGDQFYLNGVYIDVPESKWEQPGKRERMILGH